jgi:hypothetical protein
MNRSPRAKRLATLEMLYDLVAHHPTLYHVFKDQIQRTEEEMNTSPDSLPTLDRFVVEELLDGLVAANPALDAVFKDYWFDEPELYYYALVLYIRADNAAAATGEYIDIQRWQFASGRSLSPIKMTPAIKAYPSFWTDAPYIVTAEAKRIDPTIPELSSIPRQPAITTTTTSSHSH